MTVIITKILLLTVCLALTNTEPVYSVEHDDGHCIFPAPIAIKLSDKFLNAFFSKIRYVPMASAMFFQSSYAMVNGNSTKTSKLSKTCLKGLYEPPNFQTIFAGGNSKKFKCEFDSEGVTDCKKDDLSVMRLTSTWTNYKDVMVVVVCFATGKRTWAAFSHNQTLRPKVVESIQGHVHEKNIFDDTKTVIADYNSC